MVVWKSSLIFAWMVATAFAQDKPLPKFEDFKVGEVFKGKPAQPILTTPYQRRFQTRIRNAAASGPNFGGHYAIAEWGCGTGCAGTAMIDIKTGQTFDLPFTMIEFPFVDFAKDPQITDALAFRIDSRLLIAQGCPNSLDCAQHYLEWTGTEFKLLRKVPAVKK
jgi:hypothetical protein